MSVKPVDPRTNRYSMAAVMRARELHDAGWFYREIPVILERELGIRPAAKTVEAWCVVRSSRRAEKRLLSQRRWAREQRAKRTRPRTDLTPEVMLAWMRALRNEGLSYHGISTVALVMWGQTLSAAQVKSRLEGRTGYETKAAA